MYVDVCELFLCNLHYSDVCVGVYLMQVELNVCEFALYTLFYRSRVVVVCVVMYECVCVCLILTHESAL